MYDFAEILRFFEQKHPKYKLSENTQDQPMPVCKFFVKKSSVYTACCCIQLKKSRNVSVKSELMEGEVVISKMKAIFHRKSFSKSPQPH